MRFVFLGSFLLKNCPLFNHVVTVSSRVMDVSSYPTAAQVVPSNVLKWMMSRTSAFSVIGLEMYSQVREPYSGHEYGQICLFSE